MFCPQNDWTLLKQGAEARIWKIPNYHSDNSKNNKNNSSNNDDDIDANITTVAICKERFSKKYRHPVLDARLTKQRCRMEARLLGKCKDKGINVPIVLQVDSNFTDATSLIYLEFIDGQTVRDYLEETLLLQLEEVEFNESSECHILLRKIAEEIGTTIARLHEAGVVHGDLTTSNILLNDLSNISIHQRPSIVLIDFGLAKNTTAIEERAVDLYVLERALQSTHPTLPPSFHASLLSAYTSTNQNESSHNDTKKRSSSTPNDFKHDTIVRLEKVRQRGRKRECFG